jgi:hypothetical protein
MHRNCLVAFYKTIYCLLRKDLLYDNALCEINLGGQVFIFVIVDMFSLLLRSFWCLFTNEGNLQLPCAFLRLGVWSAQ